MSKPQFQTLEGYATALLLDAHAIVECEHHGYMKDRTDPHAWDRAREAATKQRYRHTSKNERLKAIDEIMHSIGDTCPDCR
ncbi:MAG TPA: hypothetical protein VGC26_09490 [Afipia sp.]